MSAKASTFYKNQMRLAEEYYQRGNLKEATKIACALMYGYPNTSENHCKISQTLLAYQIHWKSLQNTCTHYDILGISNPLCIHQMIQRKYMDLVARLCPDTNTSAAAKSAFAIINNSWMVLSDHEKRMEYDVENGFIIREDTIMVDAYPGSDSD